MTPDLYFLGSLYGLVLKIGPFLFVHPILCHLRTQAHENLALGLFSDPLQHAKNIFIFLFMWWCPIFEFFIFKRVGPVLRIWPFWCLTSLRVWWLPSAAVHVVRWREIEPLNVLVTVFKSDQLVHFVEFDCVI